MNGQWVGQYNGSNQGTLVIDLDDLGTQYAGRIYAYDNNLDLPFAVAYIAIPRGVTTFREKLRLSPIDPRTRNPGVWTDDVAKLFPGVTFPEMADVIMTWEGDAVSVEWKTDIGTSSRARILRSRAAEPTEYVPLPDIRTWEQFKTYVNGLEHRRYIFRGQKQRCRLRTTFHRTGRADLVRFVNEDIPTLHRHLSSRTNHIFNLTVPDQNGAFFNLVQHYGYPTPLLDWTYSPYVGVFFAYHHVKNSEAATAGADDKVRVFLFDQKQWRHDRIQMTQLVGNHLHFSIMEFIALNNERLIPQQSISSVTNIDDIESYIKTLEAGEKAYLSIIDLPIGERPLIMRELSAMGITAGSLFPGIEGACTELKERMFPNL